MNSSTPDLLVLQVKTVVESKDRSHIRLNSNGGNSILLVCDPTEEMLLIQAIHQHLTLDQYQTIDLNDLLCEFVNKNREILIESFDLLKGSPEQIFKLPKHEEGIDLFSPIMEKISTTYQQNKIPVLIHTGALFGSGIDNIHIMEHPVVMEARNPVVILYPATHEKDKLLFLGIRPSSKYRCMIVE